jgi:hypothetical protein
MGVILSEPVPTPSAVTSADGVAANAGAADPLPAPQIHRSRGAVQPQLGGLAAAFNHSRVPPPASTTMALQMATASGSGAGAGSQRSGSAFQSADMGDLTPEMSPEGSPRGSPQRLENQHQA